jgi:hypothetical protein
VFFFSLPIFSYNKTTKIMLDSYLLNNFLHSKQNFF